MVCYQFDLCYEAAPFLVWVGAVPLIDCTCLGRARLLRSEVLSARGAKQIRACVELVAKGMLAAIRIQATKSICTCTGGGGCSGSPRTETSSC